MQKILHHIIIVNFIILTFLGWGYCAGEKDSVEIRRTLPASTEKKMSSKVSDLKKSMEALTQKIEDLEGNNESLRKRVRNAQKHLKQIKKTQKQIPEPIVNVVVREIEKEDTSIDETLQELKDEIQGFKRQKVELEDNIIRHFRKQNMLKKEIKDLRKTIPNLEREIRITEREIFIKNQKGEKDLKRFRVYQDSIISFAKENIDLRTQLDRLKTKNRDLSTQESKIEAGLKDKKGSDKNKMQSLAKEIQNILSRNKELIEQLSIVKDQYARITGANEKAVAKEERQLEKRLDVLKHENEDLQSEITSLMKMIEVLNREKNEIEALLDLQGE